MRLGQLDKLLKMLPSCNQINVLVDMAYEHWGFASLPRVFRHWSNHWAVECLRQASLESADVRPAAPRRAEPPSGL